MKKIITSSLLLALSIFGMVSAWDIAAEHVTQQPVCSQNESEHKVIDIYMTWDTYRIYPYDAYWNNDNDVLINNQTSIQIRSDGNLSDCNNWVTMSNYVKKGHPSGNDMTLLVRTKNDKGCVLHKPTIPRTNTTSINTRIHYTIWYKEKGGAGERTSKFYYRTVGNTIFNCLMKDWKFVWKSNTDECPTITVKYEDTQKYHRGECMDYRIFRCGDGQVTNGETCDPQAEPWISNNACDPVTCKETAPKCNSTYNWQTVTNLVEWSYLCEVWSVSNFVYDETTHMWTWKCQNKAGNPVECYAKKPYKGELNVKKELLGTQYVTSAWEELRWQITVTAEWWDINNVVIKDKLPKTSDWRWVLSYVNYSQNLPEGVNMNANQPERKDNGLVLERHTTWTLKSGQSIILIVTTKVEIMPDKDWYENVACARAEWLNEKCEPVPINTSWKIEVKKEVVVPADKIVTKTWESVEWKITVKAIGWDVEMKYIEDTLPDELVYDSYKKEHVPAWITIYDPENPGKVITWKTTWTLKSWEYIELRLYTKVDKMPQEQVKNIACAVPVTWWKECGTWQTTRLRIKKYILIGNSEVKSGTVKKWDTVTYRIYFWNSGDTKAYISLKDMLPKGIQYSWSTLTIIWWPSHDWQFGHSSWVDILSYSKILLRPNQHWILTIWGTVKEDDNQDNTMNFACIFNESGKRIDCDEAYYTIWWWSNWWWSNWWHNPYCDYAERTGNNNVFCQFGGAAAEMRLVCMHDDNTFSYISDNPKPGKTRRNIFKNVWSCDGKIVCQINIPGAGWESNSRCTLPGKESTLDSQGCFNVNAWNFSVHEWEIFPFYWNMRNMENWIKDNEDYYTTIDGNYKDATTKYEKWPKLGSCDEEGSVALDSMVCTFEIYDGNLYNERPLYTIEWPCLSEEDPIKKSGLLQTWYNKMVSTYCTPGESCYFSYKGDRDSVLLPSAVYYITNFWKNWGVYLNVGNWEGNWDFEGDDENKKSYWEYKIRLSGVKYLQCEDSEWKQVDNPEEFASCESNFVLTNSYTVQKTPSGNLKASTDKLSEYYYIDWKNTYKASDLLNAISSDDYKANTKVKEAMDTFIQKYEKLAVKVDTDKFWKNGKAAVKKVPWKDIYFVDGDVTFKQGSQNINKAFTIVQTNWNTTIDWDLTHNMMLLTNWNIKFSWDCESIQTVKWIFYAGNVLTRGDTVKKNNNINQKYWCTKWWLYVKWVLIWGGFNNLMDGSRSNLNDWFKNDTQSYRKNLIMNWASVLIEYSPSIFSKSTMPPGAEDFTTALSIYKN